jgi:hypothetical protein
LFDRAQVRLDRGEPLNDRQGRRAGVVGWIVAGQHGVQVARVPAERDGEGFQGPGAAASLRGVVLQLAHDRLRDVCALGEVALAHAEFVQPSVHRLGNGRPVRSRHRFPALCRGPPGRRG